MGWYIHHVNISAYDVAESARFYRHVAGMEACDWVYPDPERKDNQSTDVLVAMGANNRGVHIVKPRAMFAHQNGFMLNPTIGGHFAITVADLAPVRERLAAAGIPYDDAGIYAMADVHQLYMLDPSMNLVEINQVIGPRAGKAPLADEEHGVNVQPGGWYLHHVNIAVVHVQETARFYETILGIEQKELVRPVEAGNFAADSEALTTFGSENRGLHLIRPVASWGKDNDLPHNPSIGGHFAVCVPDLEAVKVRLAEIKVPYSDAGSIAMDGFAQVFCFDPSMNLVEFNARC